MRWHGGIVVLCICFWSRVSLAGQPEPITLYVAPNGNDGHSGRRAEPTPEGTDGPLATIAAAQHKIRSLRHEGPLPGPVVVRIRGEHHLEAPLVFTPEDSGTETCPITYTGYPEEKPLLSGARRITRWQKGDGPIWIATIPEVQAGKWYFRQLFVGNRRATRARNPNQGYFQVTGLVDVPSDAPWNLGVESFRFKPGDIKLYEDLNNVEAVVFHSWNTSRVRIAQVDEAAGIVRFTGKTIFRPLAWDPQQRYYVENARELLDAPGEWYLERATGKLFYWPLPEERIGEVEVVAPVLGELVRLEGDPGAGKFVDHIRLVGLRLEHADWSLPEAGYGDPQAAVTVPAVVMAQGARHCEVEDCQIAHVGTYGIWFGRGSKHNRMERNHLFDLGAGGVRIGEDRMAPSDQTEASHNKIINNYIHDGGLVYAGAVGLWIAQSSHNYIAHNEIHSFNYTGISIGWNWDESPNRTHHNIIEYNHIHHVMQNMLSDGGGIYTLGVQPGAVLRNNIIHDVWPYRGSPAMAWGIYFDSGSTGFLVENNLVYHTLTGGLMNTGNPGNTVQNNIFALSAWEAVWRYTFKRDPPSVVQRNIFYLTQGDLFHNDAGQNDFRSQWDYNVYWRTDGAPLLFYDEEFAEWQAKGMDKNSLIADPLFVDPTKGDFRLQSDSPALKLGFRPIDFSQVGLTGPPQWRELPRKATFPPTVLPPPPMPLGPVSIHEDFEDTEVGKAPKLAVVVEEGRGDSIRITDQMAASGKHSLQFTDAPDLKHTFNPHLFYIPRAREGEAALRFQVRLEQGAVLVHEWRDSAQPYRVGPSLVLTGGGKLTANGKPLLDLPADTWVQLEIKCPLGKKATGTYTLSVSLPNEPPKHFADLPCGHAEFRRLWWLGLVSLAQQKKVFYVDNIHLVFETANTPNP